MHILRPAPRPCPVRREGDHVHAVIPRVHARAEHVARSGGRAHAVHVPHVGHVPGVVRYARGQGLRASRGHRRARSGDGDVQRILQVRVAVHLDGATGGVNVREGVAAAGGLSGHDADHFYRSGYGDGIVIQREGQRVVAVAQGGGGVRSRGARDREGERLSRAERRGKVAAMAGVYTCAAGQATERDKLPVPVIGGAGGGFLTNLIIAKLLS